MPTLTAKTLRELLWLVESSSQLDIFRQPELVAELKAALRPSAKKAAAKSKRAAAKKAKRETKAAETRAIREAVFERADGRCEMVLLHGVEATGVRCGLLPEHLHHVHGRIRERQSTDNCLALCGYDHSRCHGEGASAVEAWGDVVATLEALGLPTKRAKDRLAKAMERAGGTA